MMKLHTVEGFEARISALREEDKAAIQAEFNALASDSENRGKTFELFAKAILFGATAMLMMPDEWPVPTEEATSALVPILNSCMDRDAAKAACE